MKKHISTIFVSLFISLMPAFALAGQGADEERRLSEIEKAIFMASATQERVLRIGLVDCVLYALKNNSEVLVKRIDPKLKQDDVLAAKADFEPTLTTDFNFQDSTVLSSSLLQGADRFSSIDMDFNAGISGKLYSGTKYNLDFLNQRYSSDSTFQIFNPYYEALPQITITQPLFRGFGILVNRANIIVAKNNKMASEESFKDTLMQTITKAKSAYYRYVFYLESYDIDKLALQRAQDLQEINTARYEKGLVSSVDLLETESAVAQKEKALLAAESELKYSEDQLKLVTNLVDDPETWNARIDLVDKPEFKKEDVELLPCLKNAFVWRPDYQSAQIDLKNRDVKIQVAKNALLPTLDLTGSFGLNGLGKDYRNALENVNSNYADWSLGVNFSLPWGTGERAQFDQRKLEKAQALLVFKRLEQSIILDVRDRFRKVEIQYRQVEVAKISLEKETENNKAQLERYSSGEVSTHDMLDYQDKLSQAELDYLESLIDYNLALINLDLAQGLTLAKNDIKLEE